MFSEDMAQAVYFVTSSVWTPTQDEVQWQFCVRPTMKNGQNNK